MRRFLMIKLVYILSFFTITLAITELPDFNNFKWKILNKGRIPVQYYEEDGIMWCRAYTNTDYSIEEIAKILENKANYPNVFQRITEAIVYQDDIVHIKLDMPFPFSGRDYIVQYTEITKRFYKEYEWMHYDKLNIPVEEGYVRLPRAAGKWRLIELKNGQTRIEYIWNGELLGDFPSLALTRAWKKQGTEVLTWLINYMDNSRAVH